MLLDSAGYPMGYTPNFEISAKSNSNIITHYYV